MYNRAALLERRRVVSRRRGLLRLSLLGVMMVVLASYISPVRTYLERSHQIAEERRVTQEIGHQQEQLLNERDKLQSNEYVEQVARRDLGLIRPGEQPFVVKDVDGGNSDVASGAPTSAEGSSLFGRMIDWLSSVFT